MAQNTLMFEVGVSLANEQLQKVKTELEKGAKSLRDMLQLKVSVDGISNVVAELGKIGDNKNLRNLREEIAALNREFALLSKGAGGAGDIASRGISQDIEKQRQSLERYKKELVELTEQRAKLVGGTRNPGYASMTKDIEQAQTRIDGANAAIKRLENELAAIGKSGASSIRVADDAVTQLKRHIDEIASRGAASSKGGVFDPQKFLSLQEAVDKMIKEIYRLQQAFQFLGDNGSLSNIANTVNGLAATLSTLSNAFKFNGSTEEITAYENKIKSLQEQIQNLEVTLKQAKEGMKMVASGKGSEATQNANLDTLKAQYDKVTAAIVKMESEYSRMEAAGAQNASLKERLELLRSYQQHLEKVKSMDLSKAGALKASDVMFNGNMLFGQINKQMYSDKAVKEFAKIAEETIKGKAAVDSLNEAFERMKTKMLGVGSSASGGMRGLSTAMESINTIGERNIQTLIKEQAHVERLIAVAQKSINFGEGHNVAGMGSLRAQQKANLEYLENVRNAIRYILENRNVPEWMRFLNTPGSLRIPLPGAGNDIALLGGHFDKLTHSVTGTSQAMHKLHTEMQLGDKNDFFKKDNTENLKRGLYNVERAIDRIKEQWAKVGESADVATTRSVASMLNGLNELRSRISSAMQNDDLLRSRRGSNTVMNADYDIMLKNAQQMRELLKRQNDERVKSEREYMKEVEKFTEQSKKAYAQAEKEKERAAKERAKAVASVEKEIQKEIDKTNSLIAKNNASITRGENAGRDMSAIKAQNAALEQQIRLLDALKNTVNSGRTDPTSSIIEKRINETKVLRNETESLKKSEDNLTRAREKANVKRDNTAIKRLQDEEKSVNAAYVKYNRLTVAIKEYEALQQRGVKANLDVSSVERYISYLKEVRQLMDQIINNGGRTGASNPFNLRAGMLTSEALTHNNLVGKDVIYKMNMNPFREALTDAEKRMRNAETAANSLDKKVQDLEAKKVDFRGLDTTRLDTAIQKIRDIQAELQRFSQTGQSAHGDNAGAIAKTMGLAAAQREAKNAMTELTTAQRENERAAKAAAQSKSVLTAEEQKLAQAMRNTAQEAHKQSQVMSDLKMMATQYLGVWGAQGFLRNIIEIGGQLEMQRLSIGAILGDMAKANELFDRIKDLAVKSPFGVVELDQMTKQLSAYGFEYKELFDMTKRLADISAATGTDVSRLALALGHVRSEAALSGYTLRQFSMANIPMAKKLSEQLSEVEGKFVSVADVRKRVRTKDIGYEQVLKVLKDLTDEGGMFYNAQEVMSESVKARFKNLKDSMDIMYGEIAESAVGGGLKNVASLLTKLTRHWEELGSVLVVGAGYWAMNRLAMFASNKAIVQGNLALGRFSAAQLEMQATTGNLTRAQLLRAVASKRLAVADAEAAGAVLGLSKAQLMHVASTGKVTAATNMATIATSRYTVAQLRTIAAWRNMNLGWLAAGWIGLSKGITSATVAAWGFLKSMWPLMAISAVVELFVSAKREAQGFADAANYVGQSARQSITDIDNALKSISSNGKPVDDESLRDAVDTMKEVLEQSEFYTAEQQNQVENATTLSKKYDILLQQLKDMREEAEWQANNEGLIGKILSNTGKEVVTGDVTSEGVKRSFGSRLFNDSLAENMDEVNKSNSELDAAVSLLAEYQNVMQAAIEKNNNFGLSLDGKKWQEQVKMIAESGHWDEFVGSVDNAGSRFKDTADRVKDASDDVRDKWDEVVRDDFKAIMVTMENYLGTTEDGVKSWAKTNQNTVKFMADGIAKALKLSEKNIEKFMRFFYSLFGLEYKGVSEKKGPNEYDLQTDLGRQVLGNVIRHNKNNGKGGNGVTSVKEINEITGTGEHAKDASEVVKTLKERAQKDLQTMKDTEKLYGKTSQEYANAKKKYDHSLNLAVSNGITEDEIKSGKLKDKKDNKKGSQEDKDAKELRERVRILKEAADSYKYWMKAVGDANAKSHVNSEYGAILGEQGFKFEDIKQYEQTLKDLRAKYQATYDATTKGGRKRPQLLEAIKEIDKVLAQIGRQDFEKKVENFASQMTRELDELSRSFDIFTSVRNATGDAALAERLTGITPGATSADLKRYKVASFAGVGIDFNSVFNMSDEQIDRYVETLGVDEEKIKAVQNGLKDWKKAQQEVSKSDIENYAQWLGSFADLQSIVNRNQDEYNRILEQTNRLLKEGKITQEEANRRNNAAATQRDTKNWQASSMYANLYNNSQQMALVEFAEAYIKELSNLKAQLNAGIITQEQYAEKIAAINKIASEFNSRGFLGIRGGLGAFLGGGISGLAEYHRGRANYLRISGDEEGANKEDEAAAKLEKQQKATEQVIKAFQDLADGADFLGNLFDSLGMTGAANAFSDAGGVLSGAIGGASQFAALGPWGAAAGAALGLVGGIAQLHDKSLQRQIEAINDEIDAIEANTEAIKRSRERTLGYDYGKIRSQMANLYRNTVVRDDKYSKMFNQDIYVQSAAKMAMQQYYSQNSSGTGYKQELDNLKKQREDYIKMYDVENKKKKKSQDALDEYQQNIAELDDQIYYFVEDLANEIWGIDLKAWASQISDALWTAFENGEDAVKAFHDTAKDIIADVAKRMMNMHFIEPAFKALEDELFGKTDSNGNRVGGVAYNSSTGELNEQEVLRVLGKFFGEGGAMEKNISAAQKFYELAEKASGFDFSPDDESTSTSGSIKGITEQTADLLASYINAIRADVSVDRGMIAQYFPLYYTAMTNGNDSLRNLETYIKAIMQSNDALMQSNQSILDRIDGLRNKTWKLPVS